MAVQFQSAPAFHPSPFVIYNNNKNNTLTDIGEALGALGNMPNQFQQAQIRDNLNQLLIKALTAPKTEMQAQPDTLKPGYSISEDTPTDFGQFSFANSMAGNDMPPIGNILTKVPDKEVPGKDYTEATNRLGDVGYTGGGFNFAKKNKLEDLLTLEYAKQSGRQDLEATRAESKASADERRNKAAMERLVKNQEGRKAIADNHDKTMRDIADDKNTSLELRARNALAESSRHHQAIEGNARDANSIRKQNANTLGDIQVTGKINMYLDDLAKQRAQIDKIAQGDLTDPSKQTEYRTSIEQYNNTAKLINGLDPNLSITEYTERDTPQGIGNWLRSLGNAVAPTLINPPSPTLSTGGTAKGTPRATTPAPASSGGLTAKQKANIRLGLPKDTP